MIFNTWFNNGINMRGGRLLTWSAPPLQWIGNTGPVNCVSYSPNGCYIATDSDEMTIRIWDAESGVVVGAPLTGYIRAIPYSPDRRHIISGSDDGTIRTWDAETSVAVGNPLKATRVVCSLLHTFPMGATSPPDPMTTQFGSGALRRIL